MNSQAKVRRKTERKMELQAVQVLVQVCAKRSIVSRSTKHRLTLHGASPHTPRSIGPRSTEHRLTLHGASARTACCVKVPLLRPSLKEQKESVYTPYNEQLVVAADLCRQRDADVLPLQGGRDRLKRIFYENHSWYDVKSALAQCLFYKIEIKS